MKTATLLCLCFLTFSYGLAASSEEDVYEYLWENNKDIADTTLRTDFLIQMQNGSLQAERYVSFTNQDINYLLKVTKMLKKMSLKVTKPSDLRDFMKDTYLSYKSFADLMLKQYFFKGEPPIQQTPAMSKYLSFYRRLEKEDPLYFAVGLLPCVRLWHTSNQCLYYTWKKDNMDGHPEEDYRDLLNKYLDTPDKKAKANTIFRTQMQNEHDFFSTS
ncbi:hypothetical protein ABG768_020953 [Culter alburnus]|uniref:Uncharacterized protein n=1 Tax=Culter alburnus TaxID=194366 RepID=A0AAW2AS72_CULAL